MLAGLPLCATALSPLRAAAAASVPIDEPGFVTLNGVDQFVTIRGASRANPVVLILGGGPGIPMTYLAPAFRDWERDFTVVQWDQPGSGGTFMKNGGAAGIGDVTIDRFARDGLALVDHVRRRLGARRIILLGYSWGSMVGLTMIARRPDAFSAYLGTGQAIDTRRSEEISYRLVLERARAQQDKAAIAALEALGPPPYTFEQRLQKQRYATAPTEQERARTADLGRALAATPPDASWAWPKALGPYDAAAAFMATQKAGFADAQRWSAAPLGDRFRVPLFFAQGEQDMNTVVPLVQEFVGRVRAPHKELILLAGAGHGTIPYFRTELLDVLRTRIVPSIRRS
jgi:pimeloyl-ACP methyl ester carboxylesterase